jgi:dihydrofolate reductase
MRKVILFVNCSLDGFVGGEDGDISWMLHDEEMDDDFTADLQERADMILTGRATYESFEGAWPARAEDASFRFREFARWMIETPMVVFSKGEPDLGMKNARLATLSIPEEVAMLREEPGRDMVIFGGASTVQEFVGQGLIDEYWVKIMPVALGRGLPIFSRLDAPADLTLAWSKVYASGVVGLRYVSVRAPGEISRIRYAG